ncbi:hypothetical protein LIA77_10115 [Sarocladium implicatum]|nr:hypothetical protein LIA77_10115 [Sarocladium implicatum]
MCFSQKHHGADAALTSPKPWGISLPRSGARARPASPSTAASTPPPPRCPFRACRGSPAGSAVNSSNSRRTQGNVARATFEILGSGISSRPCITIGYEEAGFYRITQLVRGEKEVVWRFPCSVGSS